MTRQAGAARRAQRAAVRQLPLLACARCGVTRRSVGAGTVRNGSGARGQALAAALRDARERTLRLYAHLTPGQRRFPPLDVVNPPDWELGHVGWFQEYWCRRWRRDDPAGAHTPSRLPRADAWFDSRHVPHDTRWDLPLPEWDEVLGYLAATLDDTLARLPAMHEEDLDRAEMALLHEDMHGEALLMTLQTLALPGPDGYEEAGLGRAKGGSNRGDDDVAVAGGTIAIGTPAGQRERFVWDNERDSHDVDLRPFAIARHPVAAGGFADFVDDGGYREPRWWSRDAVAWLAASRREHPAGWRNGLRSGTWEQRVFDRWEPLAAQAPVRHVNAFEAQAWCRWAGRRLPSEVEWEHAAQLGIADIPGEVWEWTASAFLPYPGFAPGNYAEYSVPWFGDHRVLRGGSWATRERLVHRTFRNFYRPGRHDPFVGFRTCAGEEPQDGVGR